MAHDPTYPVGSNYRAVGNKQDVIGGALLVEAGGAIDLGANITVTVTGTNAIIAGLPTADPHVVGALWASTGVLTVSAG